MRILTEVVNRRLLRETRSVSGVFWGRKCAHVGGLRVTLGRVFFGMDRQTVHFGWTDRKKYDQNTPDRTGLVWSPEAKLGCRNACLNWV